MAQNIEVGGLKVARELVALVHDEIAPGTGVKPDAFWASLAELVRELEPKNRQLLSKRDALQERIDAWHRQHTTPLTNAQQYKAFLGEIGYLVPEGNDFRVTTENVDREIAQVAGPQLVVPVDNPRYALNAANARWGSLYDALYGTDVIPETDGAERGSGYNPVRGAKVIAYTETFLDQHVRLAQGSYSHVTQFRLAQQGGKQQLVATLRGGHDVGLADPSQFAGYRTTGGQLSSILLVHHGLHIEIQIDRHHPVGRDHAAGVKDVILEAAVTTIQDCEDSVAAVDAQDKTQVYRNRLGIMRGTLEATLQKDGRTITRQLNPDKSFTAPNGTHLTLPGRSLLLIRNVGIHMVTDAVTTADDRPIPEGFLDAMVTSLAAMHDLLGLGKYRNSRTGSIYIVKPKLHGPEEVAATVELFARVENALGLAPNTLNIGIMDE